jgi:hypothetical protein
VLAQQGKRLASAAAVNAELVKTNQRLMRQLTAVQAQVLPAAAPCSWRLKCSLVAVAPRLLTTSVGVPRLLFTCPCVQAGQLKLENTALRATLAARGAPLRGLSKVRRGRGGSWRGRPRLACQPLPNRRPHTAMQTMAMRRVVLRP